MTLNDQIPFLYKIAYKYTRQATVADDLVQETVYKALKYKDKFKKGTNLKGWLSMILRNNYINEYRKQSKYFNTDNIIGFVGTREKYTAQNKGYSNIELEYINKVIGGLPSILKDPFMLHYEGYTYNEIAEKYDVPLGTIKSRIHHARRELKKKLKHLKAA